jgi:hypothetical protein
VRRERLIVGAAALAVGWTRWLARARVPDDYDSIGFVRALDWFNLSALQPHPPGYPVYVALGKVAHLVLPGLAAACLVSVLAAAATAVALWSAGRALGGNRAGWAALGLFAAAWMPLLLGGAALSESLAGAFAAWSAALALRRRWVLSALMVALMLGARPSWLALALSWLVLLLICEESGRRRALALAAVAAGVAVWAIPFAIVVGPSLPAQLRSHVAGHFSEWGGTIATQPQLGARAWAFFRDLVHDGLIPHWGLLVPFALALAFTLAFAPARPSRRSVALAAVVVVPYALWAFFAQNILEQPRHLFPLVLALILACACVLARKPPAAVAAVLLCAAASIPLAVLRVRVAPAAAQAAAWIPENTHDAIVFGGRSIRFIPPKIPTIPRTWLSEVDVELERLDRLPAEILVTSEVEPDKFRAPRLHELVTFCRDARIDRQQPCLTLFRYAR